MKILMVSSYLPYPLFSGGHIRLYNILKHLSKRHQITLICEKRDHQTENDMLEVKKFCDQIVTVDRKKQWSLINILKTAFTFYPFLLVGHTNELMKEKIKEFLEKENFNIIHIETFYVMQNVPKTKVPVILIEHNIEYLVYKRFADSMPFFIRPLLYLDIFKLKYWEESFWRKAKRLIAVSDDEKKIMRKKEAVVVQNGVDLEKFKMFSAGWRTKFKMQKRILFIGDFKWLQNKDSVEWILKEIWPIINSKLKSQELNFELKLWIVGRSIPDSIKKLGYDNVIFDENAPKETAEIFKKADVLLAPIRVGGGTNFKILEAMASGIPVVTTRLGAEGTTAREDYEILVSDDKDMIADLVLGIISNEKAYEKIRSNARKLIEERYDWEAIVKKLEVVYRSAFS